jgi:large subunit ribosomal protein L9
MQVILVSDVDNLGQIGDVVNVKPGYARNFLLPKKLAVSASTGSAKRLAHEKRLAELEAMKARAADELLVGRVRDKSVTIARKVGEQDKLYGSVTAIDIEEALAEEGLEVDRKKIQLAEPIKAAGVYDVPIKLRADLSTEIKVWVVAE